MNVGVDGALASRENVGNQKNYGADDRDRLHVARNLYLLYTAIGFPTHHRGGAANIINYEKDAIACHHRTEYKYQYPAAFLINPTALHVPFILT